MFKKNSQMNFTIAVLYRFKQFVNDVMMCPRATKKVLMTTKLTEILKVDI